MPTYEYQCRKCAATFEVKQRISEPPLTTHDGCGGEVTRLLSAAPFILKGEGWYVTDYPSEARKKAREAETKTTGDGAKSDAPKGEAKSGEKKSDATASSAPASSSTASPTSAPSSD